MSAADSFANWLASEADNLKSNFEIKHSARVPGGIRCSTTGFGQVLNRYFWRAAWPDGDHEFVSDDWATTLVSLNTLKLRLSQAVESGSRDNIVQACSAILAWGGDRTGGRAGALPFLDELGDRLPTYLTRMREVLSLDNRTFACIEEVRCMNAMMTKVHALLADDGLPIYDSRVAGAAASLVEIYRRKTGQNWEIVPDDLNFPSTDRRRTACRLVDDAVRPSHIYYNLPNTTERWSRAKIKLGRVMRAAVDRVPRSGVRARGRS